MWLCFVTVQLVRGGSGGGMVNSVPMFVHEYCQCVFSVQLS